MREPSVGQVWISGEAYEPYVGRWSRLVARVFLDWLAVAAGSRWLDVGCGTGALTATIVDRSAPLAIDALDPSDAYVAHTAAEVADTRVTVRVGRAEVLPFAPATFDAVVSGLVLNFVSDPGSAVAEMARVTRAGGTVAAYVWDYGGEMQLMRRFWDAAVALDPVAVELDEGRRFPLCQPEPLQRLFGGADLAAVETRAIDVPTHFRDFEDYWSPFLGGQGPAPSYAISLSKERRAALREHLQATLPREPDGTIHLAARAWAVRGIRR